MRENRLSGLEGGGPPPNAASLPLSLSEEGQHPGHPVAPEKQLTFPFSFTPRPMGPPTLLRLHVVAEQQILVANVQFAVGNDRVRPGRRPAAVGLVKAAALDELFSVRLDQEHGALLGAIVEPPVRQGQRALRGLAIAPQNFAGLEVETGEKTALVAAVGAIKAAVDRRSCRRGGSASCW